MRGVEKSELMFADKGRCEASSESGLMQKQMRRQEGADSSGTHSGERACVRPRVVVSVSDTPPKENIHLQESHNNSVMLIGAFSKDRERTWGGGEKVQRGYFCCWKEDVSAPGDSRGGTPASQAGCDKTRKHTHGRPPLAGRAGSTSSMCPLRSIFTGGS